MNVGKEMLTKRIMHGLLIGGAVVVASSSPYVSLQLNKNISGAVKNYKDITKKQKLNNAFFYMKRKGYIQVARKNHQMFISLTSEGRKKAGKYMIDDLSIQKPKIWDKKWRVVVFDIPNATRITRDALRGKLIELGFRKIQQSIWIFPYNCDKEIKLLRDFFGLNPSQLQLILAEKIEDEQKVKKLFKL